jgi:hypothetical protein
MSKNPMLLKIRIWPVLSIVMLLALSNARAGQAWYLLTPPWYGPVRQRIYDTDAPLKKWTHVQAYDTAKECENEIDLGLKRSENRLKSAKTDKENLVAKWTLEALQLARCIASDDPRLK